MADNKVTQDYTMVCRTCLQSNVEMLILSAPINQNAKEEIEISYMECLRAFVQVEDTLDVELPEKICLKCASVLQISYCFMRNASHAQELLITKLREIKRKKVKLEMESAMEDVKKTKRYRCKICKVKVETKRSLKDHIKLHLDIIVYICQFCSYETHNRFGLSDHYVQTHGVEATTEQLKPKTKLSSTSPSCSTAITQDRMDGAIQNEDFQIWPGNTQQISHDELTKPSVITSSTCNTESLQVSSLITGSSSHLFNFQETNNDLNVADEFLVLPDGSLEKVMKKKVIIEYINADNNNSKFNLVNGLVLNQLEQTQKMENAVMLEQGNDIVQMDVDDLIIEDRGDVTEDAQDSIILPLEEETIPATIITQPKKLMCKICTKDFLSQEHLKIHMLTHNEIPHFFCDQCKFYTFFKIDLHQHYKSKHNLQPTNKQLQPKNKQKTVRDIYACDLCFYEADAKLDLKTHYKTRHNIEASEINLKLNKVEKCTWNSSSLSAKTNALAIAGRTKSTDASKNINIRPIEEQPRDYPNGLNCRKCNEVFYMRKKLYEHYKMHNAEEAALKQQKQLAKIQTKQTSPSVNTNHSNATNIITSTTPQIAQTQLEDTNTKTFSNLGTLAFSVTAPNITTLNSVAPLTPSSSSTYTLPSDAIPQIVETDQTIENDMDFYFNCDDDALFGVFDDDVDVENDSDEMDSEFRNVLLTSDDEFDDMLQQQNNVNNATSNIATSESYCAHCQKTFISQYQFENHMFVHRGLAPYRCELCTNLYNTKRCLIRHYRAVHKNIPTRDMIQAKGDKVWDEKIPLDSIKLEETSCLMCAKCPYETSELDSIILHLKSSHNISDDGYIMKKLAFECPRCIRSFGSKLKLLRHLDRNHSQTPINKLNRFGLDNAQNTSCVRASTSATSVTTTITNSEQSDVDASCGYKKQEQQYQHRKRYTSPTTATGENFPLGNAVAADLKMTSFEEYTSQTTPHLVSNESSSNSNNSTITNMPSISNTCITAPSFPTALDEHDIVQPLFKCKICLLTCYSLASFNEHSKQIDCRKNSENSSDYKMLFECEICHCNYKTMYLLKHHLKRHIGRKFLCVECPKTFINKVELEAHKHVHSGERPHKCDVCTKSFRYVHHLKRHKDSVHFGKRHACTEPNCGRKFTTLTQLKVHIWTHNGIVPYKCPICIRLFKKRLLLREHCLKIHDVNLSEEEMAEIFRKSLGYTNPHDFTVTVGNGKMLRRGDLETMAAAGVIKSSFK